MLIAAPPSSGIRLEYSYRDARFSAFPPWMMIRFDAILIASANGHARVHIMNKASEAGKISFCEKTHFLRTLSRLTALSPLSSSRGQICKSVFKRRFRSKFSQSGLPAYAQGRTGDLCTFAHCQPDPSPPPLEYISSLRVEFFLDMTIHVSTWPRYLVAAKWTRYYAHRAVCALTREIAQWAIMITAVHCFAF